MATNNRILNENYNEWMDYYDKIQNKFYKKVIKEGKLINGCMSDVNLRTNDISSNVSEELEIKYENMMYYFNYQSDELGTIIQLVKKLIVGQCPCCECNPCDCHNQEKQ